MVIVILRQAVLNREERKNRIPEEKMCGGEPTPRSGSICLGQKFGRGFRRDKMDRSSTGDSNWDGNRSSKIGLRLETTTVGKTTALNGWNFQGLDSWNFRISSHTGRPSGPVATGRRKVRNRPFFKS